MLAPSPTSLKTLRAHFKHDYFPLKKQEEDALGQRMLERTVKRRGFLLQAGEVCQHINFVVAGCFKLYAIDQGGKEHNLQFAMENEWLTNLASFYSQQPSSVYIEAVEPSVVLQMKHADLLDLYIHHHRIDRNFRILMERKYIELQNRVLQSISVSTKERYETFLTQYPHVAKRLPNTQSASYLGITPEFLSKIRNDRVRKGE